MSRGILKLPKGTICIQVAKRAYLNISGMSKGIKLKFKKHFEKD